MSEKEFELYLSLLSRFLRLQSGQRGEIADELRDHLEARLEELSRSGLSRADAIHAALEEFGDAAELAHHFTQIAQRRKRRFIMRCTVGTVAVLTAGILLTTAFWPANQGMQLPPVAIAQQDEAKKEEAKKTPTPASPAPKKVQKQVLPGDAITPPRDERFRAVEEKLKERITVNFPDVPFREAIEYMAQLTNVDIYIDKKSILDAGGDPDEIISHNMGNYSLDTVLHFILEPLNLSYRIFDGILIIETADKAREHMEVHIYNCRDLLEGVEERIEAASKKAADALRGPGGGEGFFALADEKPTKEAQQPAKAAEESNPFTTVKLSPEQMLIRVLCSSAKGPWEETDGDGGTITAFDGLLVVRNNQQAQREVQMVLDMLRAADKQIPVRRSQPEALAPPRFEPTTPGPDHPQPNQPFGHEPRPQDK